MVKSAMPEYAANAAPSPQAPPPAADTGEGAPRESWAARNSKYIEVASLLITVAFLCGATIGLVAGYRPLLSRAGELQKQSVQLSCDWPPLAGLTSSAPLKPGDPPRTWVNAEIRETIQSLALRQLSDNPFDAESIKKARAALMNTGWFKDDLRLIRTGQGVVNIAGTWRVPVAAVRFGDNDQLVAEGGELLPLSYKRDGSGMKVVTGVTAGPPDPGKPWLGGQVQAALKLLNYLRGMPGYEQIAGVDVAEFVPGKKLVLLTDQSNRIIWGGVPDEFNPGQVQAQVKAQRLAQILKNYGRIDAGRSMIDIRTDPAPVLVDASGLSLGTLETVPLKTSSSSPSSGSSGAATGDARRDRSHR